MKTTRTRAVVLRRTNYGEADRIVQLLTPHGRISVMAKGVRREKSRLAGGIELFAVSDVVIGQGKGELGILTSARLVQFYRHILQDYDRMQFAYEILKQIGTASETLDEPEWYDIATEVLMGLDNQTVALALTQTWFYLHFSAMLGYELNLQRDIKGDKLQPDAQYRYDVSEKGLIAAVNGELSAEHIKLLRLIATKPLAALAQIGGLGEVLPICLNVSRAHAAI
jgi:DNA repair protein RecO (recombination protein O)